METDARRDEPAVYANVGVHADVEIRLAMDDDDGPGVAIHFGLNGPGLIMDFADVDSLERLAAVAADGARQLRDRITPDNRAATTNDDADLLIAVGVTR